MDQYLEVDQNPKWIRIQNGSVSRMDQNPDGMGSKSKMDQNPEWIKVQICIKISNPHFASVCAHM